MDGQRARPSLVPARVKLEQVLKVHLVANDGELVSWWRFVPSYESTRDSLAEVGNFRQMPELALYSLGPKVQAPSMDLSPVQNVASVAPHDGAESDISEAMLQDI